MAIEFTISKRGLLPSEDGDTKCLYPRLRSPRTVDVVEFQKSVEWPTMLTRGALSYALAEVQRILLHELAEGNAVTLPGIGTFRLNLKGGVEIRNGVYHGRDVHVDGLLFQPDRELRDALAELEVEQVPYGSALETAPDELESRLTTLFGKRETVTRRDVFFAFEGTLSKHRVTAMLTRLVGEGRLVREGDKSQSRYRAAAGNFGR